MLSGKVISLHLFLILTSTLFRYHYAHFLHEETDTQIKWISQGDTAIISTINFCPKDHALSTTHWFSTWLPVRIMGSIFKWQWYVTHPRSTRGVPQIRVSYDGNWTMVFSKNPPGDPRVQPGFGTTVVHRRCKQICGADCRSFKFSLQWPLNWTII